MLPWDSYLEVLSEHARNHHVIGSAWIIVVVLAVVLIVFG